MNLQLADVEANIRRCFPMIKLTRMRPEEAEFFSRVRRYHNVDGDALAFLEDHDQIKTVAGSWITESLCDGRYLSVDNGIIAASVRSQGYENQPFDWLVEYAW